MTTRSIRCIAVLAMLGGCWTSAPAEPPPRHPEPTPRLAASSAKQCEPLSREAGLAPADGGYRRLGPVARDSLRGAIVDAARKHPFGQKVIGGRAFKALGAAVHDLRGELVACMRAADPGTPRYVVRLTIWGDRSVGAMVEEVSVKRIVAVLDQPSTEVPTSAEPCFARILATIELPASDGPGYVETRISADDPCVGAPARD